MSESSNARKGIKTELALLLAMAEGASQNHRMPGRALRPTTSATTGAASSTDKSQNHRMPGRALRQKLTCSLAVWDCSLSESSNARKGIKTT